MSVDDPDSDFLSSDSDHEAESMLPDGGTDEERYLELVHLFNRLTSFDHIYANNIILDTEVGRRTKHQLNQVQQTTSVPNPFPAVQRRGAVGLTLDDGLSRAHAAIPPQRSCNVLLLLVV